MARVQKVVSAFGRTVSGRAVLASLLAGGLVWISLVGAEKKVVIRVDGQILVHRTLQRKVGAVLAEAGVAPGLWDRVRPGLEEPVQRGMVIVVERAFPVWVWADGKLSVVFTPPAPVSEILRRAGVRLGPRDLVTPGLTTVVRKEGGIRVARLTELTVRVTKEIPPPVERKHDSSLEYGRFRVLRAGTPGLREDTFRVTYVDGREVKRVLVGSTVLRAPVSRVVAYGTLRTVYRGGVPLRFHRCLEMVATAYSPRVGRYTATGELASRGTVAVDPRVIPLGTRLYVEGYGYAVARDVGGAIRGNRIDVFFESEGACRAWGIRSVKVYLLD